MNEAESVGFRDCFQIHGNVEPIVVALADLQSSWEFPHKTAQSQAGYKVYKYTPLDVILLGCVRQMNKKGIAVLQSSTVEGGVCTVGTMLATKEGRIVVETSLPMESSKIKDAGSAITYARRYALTALIGIATVDDDDGGGGPAKMDYSSKLTKQMQDAKTIDDKRSVMSDAVSTGYKWDAAEQRFVKQ